MHRAYFRTTLAARGWTLVPIWLSTISTATVYAEAQVEFDFARTAECFDVTPAERAVHYPTQRLVQLTLPVSVRFHDVPQGDVDQLTVEITGPASGMRVFDFAPATQLSSDIADAIETTTTTKSARSLDGSLGGSLPIPYAAEVAHATPTVNAGISKGETTTEKLTRLPPKYAVVVSGTSAEGRGVFFKLKRWSQASLEGVHELSVTFIVPAGWRGGEVYVKCSAGGQRKVLFIKQSATLGAEGAPVRLYLAGRGSVRRVAKPIAMNMSPVWRPTRDDKAAAANVTAAEVTEMVRAVRPDKVKRAKTEVTDDRQ